MTYEQIEQRKKELRAEDPHGRMSGNDIDRIVMKEDIEDQIGSLPDVGDVMLDVKNILRDLLTLIQ